MCIYRKLLQIFFFFLFGAWALFEGGAPTFITGIFSV